MQENIGQNLTPMMDGHSWQMRRGSPSPWARVPRMPTEGGRLQPGEMRQEGKTGKENKDVVTYGRVTHVGNPRRVTKGEEEGEEEGEKL